MSKTKITSIVIWTLLVLVGLSLVSTPPRHFQSVVGGLGFVAIGIVGILWSAFRRPPEDQN
jgi:lipopolysaccharide export LptBFGC system permease protein LptF